MKKISLLLFLSLFIVACKTTPPSQNILPDLLNNVDPLSLIDNNSSFYIRILKNVDNELVSRVINSCVKGINKKNAELIANRIDVVYIGLNKKRNKTDYQVSASCNFPKFAVDRAISEKNNWEKMQVSFNDKNDNEIEYTVFNNNDIFLSFPHDKIACAGRDVVQMIKNYHCEAYSIENKSDDILNEQAYNWLHYDDSMPDNQIRYYAFRPQSFLTMLTGATLNFNLFYVCGYIEVDKKRDDQFIIQFEFDFKDSKFVPVARGSLSLAFGLTGPDITLETPTHLIVKNIRIAKKQLYDLLAL